MKRRTVNTLIAALAAACALALAADFVIHRHVSHPWEALPSFHALYGFVACVVLVLAAKEMRKAIRRREDHYDHDDHGESHESDEERR